MSFVCANENITDDANVLSSDDTNTISIDDTMKSYPTPIPGTLQSYLNRFNPEAEQST